jgi:peptidoglycan hydrolase-like protein with peptidoglycan-binding domain
MANSSYTYAQVKAGTGYYQYESSPTYSAGVKTMQTRLEAIGYSITANGYFESSTKTAVTNFQKECTGLSEDGCAGTGTLTQLDKVYTSSYFTTYGKLISTSSWSRAKILAGNFGDIDLIARCIWVEERAVTNAQYAVAQVIKNRANSGDTSLCASSSTYPNASKWARTLGCSGQYAAATDTNACTPVRGDTSQSDGISTYWKKATDIAKNLSNGTSFTVPKGYVVTGTSVASTATTSVSSQLFQCAASLYKSSYASSASNVITYKTTLTGNVFFNN